VSAPARFAVHVGESRFAVDIEEGPDGELRVRVDGEPLPVDGRLPASGAGSLLIGAVSYAVEVAGEGGDLHVTVDGEAFLVRVEAPGRRARSGSVAAGTAGQRLRAPMPGKVVAVLVDVGQRVEPGAGLVVLEAMKMENEFRATAAGVVAEVPVAPGQAVNAGELLVVIH
jgi:biotin carboxyl carrier protein